MKLIKQITNREDASLDKYLNDISKEPLLTPEEEVELAKKAQTGDIKAKERLILSNLRFVVSVAKQYQNQGLSLNDLINEGNLGLIKAVKRYDVTKGFKFISYAVWWIRQSILQALAENSRIIRLPSNKLVTINKIKTAISNLEQEFEREPTPEELASVLELNIDEIKETFRFNQRKISIDEPINNDDGSFSDLLSNQDSPSPDDNLMNESLKKEISSAIKTLSLREQEVIKLCYGIDCDQPHTLEEIGLKFNLTRERVRQIKEKALRKLRRSKISSKLKKYLG
ncbi:MAG: RNA polymerase sigma factor RpoD/SigA [Ignavibacterium sp.]|nr:RNA polymerase sigma factor RpoD/SigA [Ignavibacterium sp.]MCX7612421.1 RNA polymerase sigma factor RpoD/SigA [Ignavibacterium sp.]MDW8375215.1 RNA polymerase sigma factor RpoD/SigA [Ignavibacteriales bacterium]